MRQILRNPNADSPVTLKLVTILIALLIGNTLVYQILQVCTRHRDTTGMCKCFCRTQNKGSHICILYCTSILMRILLLSYSDYLNFIVMTFLMITEAIGEFEAIDLSISTFQGLQLDFPINFSSLAHLALLVSNV